MTAKSVTYDILDAMRPGRRFSSVELSRMVYDRTGETHLPDTMMRYARHYRRTRRGVVNVDKRRSIYEVRG
jgi:hypothetical protein